MSNSSWSSVSKFISQPSNPQHLQHLAAAGSRADIVNLLIARRCLRLQRHHLPILHYHHHQIWSCPASSTSSARHREHRIPGVNWGGFRSFPGRLRWMGGITVEFGANVFRENINFIIIREMNYWWTEANTEMGVLLVRSKPTISFGTDYSNHTTIYWAIYRCWAKLLPWYSS